MYNCDLFSYLPVIILDDFFGGFHCSKNKASPPFAYISSSAVQMDAMSWRCKESLWKNVSSHQNFLCTARQLEEITMVLKGGGGGGRGGSWFHFPANCLFLYKSQLKSHNPSLCCSNWNPIPIFLLFLFHESQSQWGSETFFRLIKNKKQTVVINILTLS